MFYEIHDIKLPVSTTCSQKWFLLLKSIAFDHTLAKQVLLLWIIYVISVFFLLFFRARLFIDALRSPAGKGLTSLLSSVMSYCKVVTFLLIS